MTSLYAPTRPDRPIVPAGTRLAARQPMWWAFAVLCVIGAIQLAIAFGDAVKLYPRTAVLATVLFTVHGAILVAILRTLDYLEPEPPAVLAAALAWGGLVATANALRANAAADSILTKLYPPAFVRAWGAAIEGPTNEEILKTLGLVALIIVARHEVNSVMDGVIYGAFVGIGFQEVENIAYALNSAAATGVDSFGPAWQMFLIRGLLAGLWSHAVYSAFAGAGIAYALLRRDRPAVLRIGVALAGLSVAWLAHFVWNSPLFNHALGAVGGAYGVVVTMVVKGGAVLAALAVIVRAARRSEYRALAAHLYRLDDPTIAAPAEVRALRTAHGRRNARWNAYVRHGWRAARATRALQRAQADLAVRLHRIQEQPLTAVTAHRSVDRTLTRLRAARAVVPYEVDAFRAPRTAAGWVSLLAGLVTVIVPYALAVPVALFAWQVHVARAHHRTADPRLLTGLTVGAALFVVWWAVRAAHAAQIT